MSENSVKTLLQQKLEAAMKERDELKELRDKLNEKFDSKTRFPPERPTKAAGEIDAELERLSAKQSTTSMSIADERKLLREINDLKAMKKHIGPWAAHQAEIDQIKAQRNEASDKLRALTPQIAELRTALRRLETLDKVRVANPGARVGLQDIVTSEIPVADEHLPRLIGKAGSGLREIETSCGVVLDVEDERRGGRGGREKEEEQRGKGAAADKDADGVTTIKIMGLPSGIAKAVERIEAITSQVEIPLRVSSGVLSFLLSRQGGPIKDVETRHGLRLRLEKEEGKVHVRGLPGSIAAFKQELDEAERSKVTITVDARSLPSIIGPKGANLKQLRDDTGCEVDIGPREEGQATTTVSILCLGPGASGYLSMGSLALSELKSKYEELDLPVPIPRDAISWLVGQKGERIQKFQKDASVYARVARKEADGTITGAEGLVPAQLGAEGAAVVLRGTRSNLGPASRAFDVLMAEYRRCNVAVPMSSAVVKAIIGPGGATIKKLRADTGCNIDVDEASEGGEGAARGKAGKEGEERQRRPNRADEMGLPVGQAIVTVRGEAEKVPGCVAAIQNLVRSFREARVPATGPVFSALVRNKGELIRSIQEETGAALDIVKDSLEAAAEVARRSARGPNGRLLGRPLPPAPPSGYAGVVVVAGPDSAVVAAEAKLEALLFSKQETTVPLPDPAAVPEFMGKGGAAIRALQEETGTEVDVLKGEGVITVCGSAEGIAAAVARITAFFARFSKENASLKVDRTLLPALIGKGGGNLRALEQETGTTIKVESDGTLLIHGPEDKVPVARARIVSHCKLDKACEVLSVDPTIVGRLIGRGGGNLRKLEELHNVSIGVDTGAGTLTLRGDNDGLAAARVALKKQIKEASRAEIEVEVPQEKLGGIIGTKGTRLRQLEASTGCSIDLPRDRTAKTVTVKARGSENAVARARVVLAALAEGKAPRVLVRFAPHATELQGRDRASVERLQSELGVTVSTWGPEPVEAEEEGGAALPSPASMSSYLVLVGDNDAAVGKAVAGIDKLLAFRFGEGYALLPVPAGMASALVGDAEGSEVGAAPASGPSDTTPSLASLKDKNNVGAVYEKEGSYVAVWGTPKNVSAARSALQAAVSAFASRHGEVLVDSWVLPALIGKGGKGISTLEAESGCKITVDKDAGKGSMAAVRIAAPSSAVLATGKSALDARLAAIARTRILLRVPPSAFGSIIGKAGATIRQLQEETGANLDLDKEVGVVVIRGVDEGSADAARSRIVEIVGDMGYPVKVATAAEVAALTVEISDIPKDAVAVLSKSFADLSASSGASFSLARDSGGSVVLVKGTSPEETAAGVRVLRAAYDKHRRGVNAPAAAAASAPASTAAGGMPPKSYPGRPIGAPLPTAEELAAEQGKKSRNARRRAKKRAQAGGQAGSVVSEAGEEEEEEEQAAAVPATQVAARAAPVVAQVAALPAPAPAPVSAAPAVAAAPVAAKPAGQPSAEDLLAQLLGVNYRDLLGPTLAAPAPAPVARAQAPAPAQAARVAAAAPAAAARPAVAAAPAAAPAVAPRTSAAAAVGTPASPPRKALVPPPGFPNTPQHAAPAVLSPAPATKPVAAVPAGPVWGAKPTTSSLFANSAAPSAAAPANDIAEQLASLGISTSAFPVLAPSTAAPIAAAPAPAVGSKSAAAARPRRA